MSSILSSLRALLSSIVGLVASVLQTIAHLFTSALNLVVSGVEAVFGLFGTLGRDAFDLVSGLVGFLLGNIVIIGVLVAAFVGYTVFQQRQGKSVSGKKVA
ncbi:hypothetical protein MMC34_005703 [Xylographa carneopallida]|nr:hypothetical protein [Xylographa carneopallida]